MHAAWRRRRSESGQVMVFFALLLPVLFAIGAIVIDVGNWYVHKRHLQTQVDAGVFAAATKFGGCSTLAGDPAAANEGIRAAALAYVGDAARVDEAEGGATTNLQVQEPGDAHVVFNSGTYWAGANGPDPDVPTPNSGYGLDYTMAPIDSQGNPAPDSMPCSVKALDAKATDDDAPMIWGLIPGTASPKSHARVEIYDVGAQMGMLPFAVPEVEPAAVAAIFVDELFSNGQGAVVGTQLLVPDASPPNAQFSYWTTPIGQNLIDVNSEATGVVILLSKQDDTPTLGNGGPGTLQDICNQDPGRVKCYAGSNSTSGVNFVHGWSGARAAPTAPQVRDVSVFGCSGPSAPYFVNLSTSCSVGVTAVVDFQVPGDPTPNPSQGGIAAEVKLYASSTCTGNGDPLSWQTTIGVESIWSGGSKPIATESGRNALSIGWSVDDGPGPTESGCFGIVAAPYAADSASGPLEYVDIDGFDAPPTIDSNSREIGEDRNVIVTVGLPLPLALEDPLLPPRLIRFKGQGVPSLSGALDCDANQPQSPIQYTFKDEIENECQTTYRENYVDPDGPNGPLPKQWADITCSAYPSSDDLPPVALVNDPPPNCVQVTQGQVSAFREGLAARFETPTCTPNYWPTKPSSPADDPQEVDDFMREHNFEEDARYVTLVVTDDSVFTAPNTPVPIKYFAGFYITRYDISSGQGGATQGCPGEDDPNLSQLSAQADDGHLWGHFVKQVFFPSMGDPSEQLCNFDEVGTCIAVLVE